MSYLRLFRYATTFDKILIVFAIVVTFIGGLVESQISSIIYDVGRVIYHYVSRNVSKCDVEAKMSSRNLDERKAFMALMWITVKPCIKVALVIFFCSVAGTTAMKIASYNQIFKVRKLYLRAALSQDLYFYDEKQDDLASVMEETAVSFEEGINDRVTQVTYSMAIVVSSILTCFTLNWNATACCCIIFSFMVGLMAYSVIVSRRWCVREDILMERAGGVAMEVLAGIRTVHAFAGAKKEIERYQTFLTKAKMISIRREMYVSLLLGLSTFLLYANYAIGVVCSIIFFFLIENELSMIAPSVNVGDFIYSSGLSLRGIATMVTAFGPALGAADAIFELIDTKPKINSLRDVGEKLKDFQGHIELRNVYFHYPSRPNTAILNGVNLSMRRGQVVGLVGLSGTGKSTIFQVIPRLYDVISGSVCFDGRDVRDLSVKWLRAQVALVTSEPVLFNCTVRENICLGRELVSDAEVKAAARLANAHHFIMKLPQGYDTVVGERGASLSGGQKQRVAIARALVRDPPVLLFDEATTLLDNDSEAKFHDTLKKISVNRTTVIAANRLSVIQRAHIIYVLNNGEVVEQGNHSDLLEQKGHYYHMAKLQGIVVTRDPSSMHLEKYIGAESLLTTKSEETSENIAKSGRSPLSSISAWQVLKLAGPEWALVALGVLAATVKNLGFPALILWFNYFDEFDIPNWKSMFYIAFGFSGKVMILGVAMGLATFAQEGLFGWSGSRLTERLRRLMYTHLLRQDLAYFDNRNDSTGAICSRMISLTSSIRRATGQPVAYLVEGLVAFLFLLGITVVLQIRITIFIVFFLPLLLMALYYQAVITNNQSSEISYALEDSMKMGAEAVSNIGLVASLGCEAQVLRRHAARLDASRQAARCSALCCGLVTGVARSLTIVFIAAVTFYSGELILNTTFINIRKILCMLVLLESHYINALLCASEVMQGVTAAKRILHGMQEEPAIVDPITPAATIFKPSGNITFSNVFMTYPSHTLPVLTGVSLQIEAGKTYILAGQNGSGKTTIIQMIMRFYDPDSGEVAFDGIPLPQLRLADVRGSIGVVFAESSLFERTIAENIAYGDNSRVVPTEEIVEAAVQANIHSFIITLPKGYDTMIGSKGTLFSSGQKQRIALARALVRKPTILLLDDATSNLDAESQKEVQTALDKAKAGRTVVSVTRNEAALRAADYVLLLHDGRVMEHGKYADLMAAHGHYYTLKMYM